MSQPPTTTEQRSHHRHVLLFGVLVVGMFGFGFAMVPLYQLVCQVAGINSTTVGARTFDGDAAIEVVDSNRLVTVEFDATTHAALNWQFRPLVRRIDVHPGETTEILYKARNNSNRTIVAQAVPGITPWQATEHFIKAECFCFTEQKLEPGEEKEMPVRFRVDPSLPGRYHTITLSYTFMEPAAKRQNLNAGADRTYGLTGRVDS